jgi:hypothetical protein
MARTSEKGRATAKKAAAEPWMQVKKAGGTSGKVQPLRASRAVAIQVKAARAFLQMDRTELAEGMAELGFAWNARTVTEVENLTRKVSVDELVALGVLLARSPDELLLHPNPMLGGDAGRYFVGVDVSMDGLKANGWLFLKLRAQIEHDRNGKPVISLQKTIEL